MDQNTPAQGTGASTNGVLHSDAATELSARRTGMSFQRTRMSADRTLMSVIRTSLSLISFGFTIFQFFKNLSDDKVLANSHAARNFGTALVYLGVIMITVGIIFHAQFMRGLRVQRREMTQEGLIHGESVFPPSFTLVTAILLLLLGLLAIASVSYHSGPMS